MKILIADEHLYVRKGVISIIQKVYPISETDEVEDAHSLLLMAERYPWDLVITDISLPGRSVIEILKDLIKALKGCPIIILSALHPRVYALKAYQLGINGYIQKDSDSEELLKAIEIIRQGGKYIPLEIAEMKIDTLLNLKSQALHDKLTHREFEIFRQLAKSVSILQISKDISLSVNTISLYRSRIYKKLQVKNNYELIMYAIKHQIEWSYTCNR